MMHNKKLTPQMIDSLVSMMESLKEDMEPKKEEIFSMMGRKPKAIEVEIEPEAEEEVLDEGMDEDEEEIDEMEVIRKMRMGSK